MKPHIRECVERVLAKSSKSMHYAEITKNVLKMRPIVGKTPENSVYAVLIKDKRVFDSLGGGNFMLKRNRD